MRDKKEINELKCKSCNSDNIRKLSIIYESGTANFDGKASGSGSTLGTFGVGLNSYSSTFNGSSMSLLAEKASPPMKFRYFLVLKNLLIFMFIGIVLGNIYDFVESFVNFFYFFFVIVYVLGWIYNKYVYKPEKIIWDKSFMCLKCGEIFQIDDFSPDNLQALNKGEKNV